MDAENLDIVHVDINSEDLTFSLKHEFVGLKANGGDQDLETEELVP